MRNPERTKNIIIESASVLFNTQGYKATSISDITSAAGITKGAIYRHFKDKSVLEKECLIYMVQSVLSDIIKSIKKSDNAKQKLLNVLDYFDDYGQNPPFEGGCAIMNAAIEVDDTDKELKTVVSTFMNSILAGIAKVIQNGIDRDQINKSVDAYQYASFIYSSLEGGLMMMKITDNKQHLFSVISHLKQDIISKTC